MNRSQTRHAPANLCFVSRDLRRQKRRGEKRLPGPPAKLAALKMSQRTQPHGSKRTVPTKGGRGGDHRVCVCGWLPYVLVRVSIHRWNTSPSWRPPSEALRGELTVERGLCVEASAGPALPLLLPLCPLASQHPEVPSSRATAQTPRPPMSVALGDGRDRSHRCQSGV